MNKLKAKLNKQGGFTMVELLIVVAIIAILVAVSIPTMNAILERSRHAVDQANQRDAMGLALAQYVADAGTVDYTGAGVTYEYIVDKDTHAGRISSATADKDKGVQPACQCCEDTVKAKHLTVTIKAPTTSDGAPDVTTSWKNDGTGKTT